jgi:CBS domain-containing protein
VEDRIKHHANGARWQLRAFSKLKRTVSRDEALVCVTSSTLRHQHGETPIHQWPLPDLRDLNGYHPSKLKAEEFMETDLFTVQKDDLIDLVAELMDWRKIRYMPVEDTKGNLVGLITSRLLLRHYAKCKRLNLSEEKTLVKDIMVTDPITVGPDTSIVQAMHLMRDNKIGCLPVTKDNELIGVITEMDFLRISARLIEQLEAEE